MAKNKERFEAAYSIALIVLIPAAIVIGTLWLTSQFKSNLDEQLRLKADLAGEVFNVSAANALATGVTPASSTALQALVDATMSGAPEIDHISVSIPKGTSYSVLASSDLSTIATPDTSIQTQLAYQKSTAIASLIAQGESSTREWMVAIPVTSPSGSVLAVTTIWVPLATADAEMSSLLTRAFIVLTLMVAAIVLLLTHHFRLVQYAELFRKQKELDQMKDDFISIATHELKAPMTVIKGYISMALELKLPDEPAEMLKIAFDQTDRLGRLVADLLDVSRIEQGRTKYTTAAVVLPELIAPMVTTMSIKATDKHLKLNYDQPTNLPKVSADPDRVGEIMTNLIDNAIKYSISGTIKISHEVTPVDVLTTVADTGIGMSSEEQTRLFTRFYRIKNNDTKNIPGTGLGLWIIRQYARAMHGDITVTSQKGKGTTFTVRLPRVDPVAPATKV